MLSVLVLPVNFNIKFVSHVNHDTLGGFKSCFGILIKFHYTFITFGVFKFSGVRIFRVSKVLEGQNICEFKMFGVQHFLGVSFFWEVKILGYPNVWRVQFFGRFNFLGGQHFGGLKYGERSKYEYFFSFFLGGGQNFDWR